MSSDFKNTYEFLDATLHEFFIGYNKSVLHDLGPYFDERFAF